MRPRREVRSWYRRDASSRGRLPTRGLRTCELVVLHPQGGPPNGRMARTLYDLLGASQLDDTERLKDAFRKAVKANHPDLHPNDPDAAMRLSGIVRAYAILRDPHERASYDHALGFDREPPFAEANWSFFDATRNIFAEVRSVAILAVVLGGGYLFAANILSQFSERGEVAEVRGSPAIAPVELAVRDAARATIEHERLDDKPAGAAANTASAPGTAAQPTKSRDALEVVNADAGAPAAVKSIEVANVALAPSDAKRAATEAMRGMNDQIEVKITTDQTKGNQQNELSDRDQDPGPIAGATPPAPVKLSSLGNDISKSLSSDFVAAKQKHRTETPDTKSADVKPPKLTARERLRAAELQPPSDHVQTKQASLDKRTSACLESQPCSGKSSPLLGVGF
jgi:hypothetical protein